MAPSPFKMIHFSGSRGLPDLLKPLLYLGEFEPKVEGMKSDQV